MSHGLWVSRGGRCDGCLGRRYALPDHKMQFPTSSWSDHRVGLLSLAGARRSFWRSSGHFVDLHEGDTGRVVGARHLQRVRTG
jgi:hypothetical protein